MFFWSCGKSVAADTAAESLSPPHFAAPVLREAASEKAKEGKGKAG